MKRTLWLAAAVAVVSLSGCGSDVPTTPPSDTNYVTMTVVMPTSATAADLTAGPCDEVLAPGAVLTQEVIDKGCGEGETVVSGGAMPCVDGRSLYGNGRKWAFVGDPVIEVPVEDVAMDPAYSEAFRSCGG